MISEQKAKVKNYLSTLIQCIDYLIFHFYTINDLIFKKSQEIIANYYLSQNQTFAVFI